jgi:hypothetical protein
MGAPTSEVGYSSATTRRGTRKSIWTCGGIRGKKFDVKDKINPISGLDRF